MLLSIIIVNYNVKYFLEHCLLSVLKAAQSIDAEILVVDNNSSDGSKAYLQPKFNTVTFYWNTENVGFAKANNAALEHAKGEYILFLNPDTIVGEHCFTECLSFFKKNKNAGAVGVRMINGSGQYLPESKRGLPTALAGFYKMIGMANLFKNKAHFTRYYAGHIKENEQGEVAILAGAFMMLSSSAAQATKGFDERFFMYGEDIDLSYSIQQAGFKNYYVGTTTILHFKGESTQKKSANYVKHFFGAMKIFVDKHYRQQKFSSVCMKIFITLGKIIGWAKQTIFTQAIHKHNNMQHAAIVGNAAQINLLQKTLTQQQISSTTLDITSTNHAHNSIIAFANENIHANLILCEGQLSYEYIIALIPNLPIQNAVYFYNNNARCIIGSFNKNTQGAAISI